MQDQGAVALRPVKIDRDGGDSHVRQRKRNDERTPQWNGEYAGKEQGGGLQ